MRNDRTMTKTLLIALIAAGGLIGCSHEAAFEKRRAECRKMSAESERGRCLQNVEEEERAYERQRNETRIERNYKRKLEDMNRR